MKTLNYNEIYYTSSECSIITHSAGFGVRTYTTGMNSQDVTAIAHGCMDGYAISNSRILTFQQIQQNPKIVYDYTPAYFFRKVTLNDGSVKYVFGRTIYIAIDYGYFCNKTSYMRTGSNYFTHLIVFDEMPPISIFTEIMQKGLFSPKDYTCSPENTELQFLLTGTPQLLPPKAIQYDDTCVCDIDNEFAYCILGLLQSAYNTANKKEDNLKKIIIKAPAEKTPELIQKMSLMPAELMGERTFLTNYLAGYGVPDGIDIVFVNEYNTNELYENVHICVDLFNKTTTNVDSNYIFQKILELSTQKDNVTIQKLVNYYLHLDLAKNIDYQFLYNLFIAVESDRDITLNDISPDFISKLSNVRLSQEQETKLWKKINVVINNGLQSTSGAEVKLAIYVAGNLLTAFRDKVYIAEESSGRISEAIFGLNSFLAQIVTTNNIDTIMFIIGFIKESPDKFYNALRQTSETKIWSKFINFYYGNSSTNLLTNIDTVVENILSSNIGTSEKEGLITQFYPIDKRPNELFAYILKNTQDIPQMPEITKTLCLNSPERISQIIIQSNNAPHIIRLLSPIVLEYYERLIDANHNSGMNGLLYFAQIVTPNVFNMMGITNLFEKYIKKCYENHTEETKPVLDHLLSSNLKIDKQTLEQITALKNLFDKEVPESVNIKILTLAHKMHQSEDFIKALFAVWLKSTPSTKELKDYVKGCQNLSPDMIGYMMTAIWKSKNPMIGKNREDYVLVVSDNANWTEKDKKSFIESCPEKDLTAYLTNSDKLLKKITRSLLNMIKR